MRPEIGAHRDQAGDMFLEPSKWIPLVVVLGLLAGRPGIATAQPTTTLDRFTHAFETGNAHALLAEAGPRVEVALFDDGKLYSRAQATYVLEAFFNAYPPDHFEVQHESTAEGSWFVSGRYHYQRGARPLQVYLRCRHQEDRWVLRELHIAERVRE